MARSPLLAGLAPTHPGEILREVVLPATGVSKTQIAEMLGISRQALHVLLAERQSITPVMAHKLGRLFGNSPEFWSNLQSRYDLAVTGEAMREELERMPTLAVRSPT